MADIKHAKGRLAEVKALAHFASWGCEVAPVLGDNTSCDLVVIKDGTPFRVEVKSAQTPTQKRSNPAVTVSSNTHRRADGSLPNKAVDLSKFDLLASYVPDEDKIYVWRSRDIDAKKTFTLTEERKKLSIQSGEELVESADTRRGHLDGLCLCRDCAPGSTATVTSTLVPSGHALAGSTL